MEQCRRQAVHCNVTQQLNAAATGAAACTPRFTRCFAGCCCLQPSATGCDKHPLPQLRKLLVHTCESSTESSNSEQEAQRHPVHRSIAVYVHSGFLIMLSRPAFHSLLRMLSACKAPHSLACRPCSTWLEHEPMTKGRTQRMGLCATAQVRRTRHFVVSLLCAQAQTLRVCAASSAKCLTGFVPLCCDLHVTMSRAKSAVHALSSELSAVDELRSRGREATPADPLAFCTSAFATPEWQAQVAGAGDQAELQVVLIELDHCATIFSDGMVQSKSAKPGMQRLNTESRGVCVAVFGGHMISWAVRCDHQLHRNHDGGDRQSTAYTGALLCMLRLQCVLVNLMRPAWP